MQHKNKTFWMSITVCMVIGIFFTGCGNSVVAYEDPITITLTGLEGQTTEPLAFIGVFDNEKKIMAGDALAGGFAAIQNGSAAVDLWYVEDQSPLIDTGDYYIALMFGKSQSNPTDSYFFIENKQDVKHAFEDDKENEQDTLPNTLREMVSAMIVSMSEPPTDEEIDDVLDSLAQMNGGEMDGAMEAVMASYGAKFIPYKNLQDNAAVDLSQFANVTPLYKFGELLGLVKL